VEIASGIRRLGTGLVNVYLLEEAGEVTIVDAGAPGYWKDLQAELAAMGRTPDDVRALLLTHAHSDHVGFAERIRRERAVPVNVHADDAALARGEMKAVRDPTGAGSRGWSIRAIAGFAVFALSHGMARVTPIAEVGTFLDGAVLDVPGTPRVIHVPGHTAGSGAFHAPARDAVFVGDAFVTRNVITGRRGPHFSTMFNADHRRAVASLARLDDLAARHVLPGHGDAWSGGLGEALRAVRESIPAELRGAAPQS
jgi:glyoxylase-like metal-dependent hydrolase (beta-lactamase superfamily II)